MAELNKFMMARAKSEVLEGLYNNLNSQLDDASKHYGKTGKKVQSYHWDSAARERVLEWEDDEQMTPKLEDEYDDIPYTEEELDDLPDVVAKISAIQDIMKALEKML